MASHDLPDPAARVVLVFLDEEKDKLYQLKQWLQPLERLSRKLDVEVWYASEHAAKVLAGSKLPSHQLRDAEAVRAHLAANPPGVFLYVNQSLRNSLILCDPRSVHGFISHGESDKAYMYQNTIKRFDLCFAAGEAAIRRLSQNVAHYDVARRVLLIGRPQILDKHECPADFPASGLTRVLYAPTWEGVTRATRYSSIETHGHQIVSSLLDHGGYQVVYRPHPLAGTRDAAIRRENRKILRLLQEKNAALPAPVHFADSSPFGWQLEELDVMITDVSAVAYDWLATGKALMLTRPVEPKAVLGDFRLIRDIQPMDVADAPRAAELVGQAIAHVGHEHSPLATLLHHYYGDRTDCDDAKFERAVRHALEIQQQLASRTPATNRGIAGSRHAMRVSLQKLNASLRRSLKMVGLWDSDRALRQVVGPIGEIHVHFSNSFDLSSPRRALRKVREGEQKMPMVIATNQVFTWYYLQFVSLLHRFLPGRGKPSLTVLPVSTATACETLVRVLAPEKVIYLKHHHSNHMMQRTNGPLHILFHPETDRRFEPEHTLINYDQVVTDDVRTQEAIASLLELSRPLLCRGEPS